MGARASTRQDLVRKRRFSPGRAAALAAALAASAAVAAPVASAETLVPTCPSTIVLKADADSELVQGLLSPRGAQDDLRIVSYNATKSSTKNWRSVIHFPDAPPPPAGCVVSSAFMRLRQFYYTSTSRSLLAYRAASPWSESTVTWNNQPGVEGSATAAYAVRRGWTDWNVTDSVNAWLTGTPNNGVRLQDSSEDSATKYDNGFYSREDATNIYDGGDRASPSNAPELVVRYAPQQCSAPGPASAQVSDADSDVNQGAPSTNSGGALGMSVQSLAGANKRSLVHFAAPSNPDSNTCSPVAGEVRLYANYADSTGRTLQFFQADSPWSETGVTWDNQPGVIGTPLTLGSANITVQAFNVNDAMLQSVFGANNGFVVRDSVEGAAPGKRSPSNISTFDTREKATGGSPRLDVLFG